MIHIFKGKRHGFSRKGLCVLSSFSFPVELYDSNPTYPGYKLNHFRVVPRVNRARINSNRCSTSNGLNRQRSTLHFWINYATVLPAGPHAMPIARGSSVGGRVSRRGKEVMSYAHPELNVGAEFILTRNFSKYKRSCIASTSLPRAMDSEGGSDNKLLGLLDSSPYPLNGKRVGTLLDKIYNKFAISCKESRIETNTSFYGCFYLGPFEQGESVTIANALRRTLLSDLMGVAITSVEIEGAVHEYASITGVRESVLDILLNLKEITLKQTTLSSSITFTPQGKTMPLAANDSIVTPYLLTNPPAIKANQKGVVLSKSKVLQHPKGVAASNYLERKKKRWGNQVGYLRARGPGVIRASDLKLPPYIVCVDPEQYIATLSDDGVLNMKFFINEGKNYLIQVPNKNLDLNELKRRRLFQKKMKQGTYPEGASKSFVRYAPFEITSDLLPLSSQVPVAPPKGLAGVKSFFNLRKQKKVFNDASNGNRLPIDAVFMPVTKVNYIIEPDEQSNDEQLNDQSFNDRKSDSTYVSKALSAGLGGSTSPSGSEINPPSLPLRLLSLNPEEVIAEFQNSGLKRHSKEEQRAFSNLLVNPILKTQPPSLFFKHPFNLYAMLPEVGLSDDIKMRSEANKIALRDIPETRNRKGPCDSKEQSQRVDASSSPSFSTGKGTLRHKKDSSDVNFTFLHPAPFLSVQDKQRTNETVNGSCNAKSQEEEGQQVSFKDKKQQELLFFGNSHMQSMVVKEQVVGREVFTKKDPLKFKIILEIWTNGSIHPRKALYDSFKSMIILFSRLQKVPILGSMLKSERFYNKLIDKKFNTKNVPLASQSPLTSKKNVTHSSPNGANSSSVQNANSSIKPVLGMVSRGTKIKPKGLYSLNKTVTGLQTSLPAALPKVEDREWSGENYWESEGDKLPERGQLDLITIESLNLSLRSYTCLKRSNINTINDLMGHSKKQLIQIKNFGVHSLEEIQTRLGVFGFKLKQ